jgi:AcrR family transcriptional regulator
MPAVPARARKPAAPRRPQARGVATRRRLLGEAERCFGARGYEATSMNDIAQAAGVGVGTLYHHFPDKRALLLALIDDWGDRELGRRRPDSIERYLGDDPRAAIHDGLRADAERLRRDGGFRLMLLQLAERDPDVRQRLRRIRQVARERLRDLVAYGQKRGRYRRDVDPLAAAYLIQNAINATATEVFVHGHADLSPRVMLEQLTDMICRYVLEEPE